MNVSSNEVFFTWRTSSLDLDDLEEIDVAVQEYGGIEVVSGRVVCCLGVVTTSPQVQRHGRESNPRPHVVGA